MKNIAIEVCVCVLQRYMKEGVGSSAHVVRESFKEVTFELGSHG